MVQEIEEIAGELVLGLQMWGTLEKEVVVVIMGGGMENPVLMALQMMGLWNFKWV